MLELLRDLHANPDSYGLSGVTILKGNHCDLICKALAEGKPGAATDLWLWNGGDLDFLPVAREHRDWLENLPLTAIRGNYLFVHAGVRPGVPLEQQTEEDLLWIRKPFLTRNHGLPYTVVHGHTFNSDFTVTHLPHRIGIDTGAFVSGKLAVLEINACDHDFDQ